MPYQFAEVLVFIICGSGFVLTNLLLGYFLRPKFPGIDKGMIYECGEKPVGTAWFNFNPRFYLVALVFVVFEVEIALTLPVALVYRSWIANKLGSVAFLEILSFVVILAVGLVWVWAHGDLDWVKKLVPDEEAPPKAGTGYKKAA